MFRVTAAFTSLLVLLLGNAAPVRSPAAVANSNQTPAGTLRNGVLSVRLEARTATWYPEADGGPGLEVQAFAQEGRPPQIPGPLIRVPEGTEVWITLRNAIPNATLIVHGLHTRPAETDDTIQLAPGATRETRFAAGAPGTSLYWATTTGASLLIQRRRLDTQLSGAFVVDPAGARPGKKDRILVITAQQREGDVTTEAGGREHTIFALNGKAWPYTERLTYAVGDSIRFRVVNASYALHPMHLHGFYYRVERRGDVNQETSFPPERQRLAVTELMTQGTTLTLSWSPDRAGNWVFHCHMAAHINGDLSLSAHGHAENHTLEGMSGLIIGMRVLPVRGAATPPPLRPIRNLRLLARMAPGRYGAAPGLGFLLQTGPAEPPADSVPIPGSPILLTRGEPVAITVVNRTDSHISVHWHGIELDSYYDGVGGWSGDPGHLASAIAPGDSFIVRFAPRRAGTFIYHTHVDELRQLASGLYGPLIVVEPGQALDTITDRVMLLSRAGPSSDALLLLNGNSSATPLEFRPGVRYRLRFINIAASSPMTLRLLADSTVVSWRSVGKDGADLPPALATLSPAQLRMGAGETYDFEFAPTAPAELRLEIQASRPAPQTPMRLSVPVRVR